MKLGITIILFLQFIFLSAQELSVAKKGLKLMGCYFEITATAKNDSIAWNGLNEGIEEIKRIENLISSWNKNSQTSQINQFAGIKPVKVDQELFDLIYRSKKISKLTSGAFDISFASMENIWKFDGNEYELPSEKSVQEACSKINWKNIILDNENQTVFLREKGMKISFGAIGKGFAANQAKKIMSEIEGIKGGLVNASGDITAWGKNSTGEQWKIQVLNPSDKQKSFGWLELNETAIVTSGDYEKYFTNNGKRYAHIINPKTGYPTTEIKNVTLICPDAELADALATSVFVLGVEKGLSLINQLKGIDCIIITSKDEIHQSNNINLNYY